MAWQGRDVGHETRRFCNRMFNPIIESCEEAGTAAAQQVTLYRLPVTGIPDAAMKGQLTLLTGASPNILKPVYRFQIFFKNGP